MPSIAPDEWKELVLRLASGHAELAEASARYIQVRAADEAAKKRAQEPGKLTPEWKRAGEEYARALVLYRQAGDSLAALSLCGLWPRHGKSVGSHVLSMCDEWVAQAQRRPAISVQMERIHFAMMQMGQVVADPARPKPADLSPAARSALEASGWKISPLQEAHPALMRPLGLPTKPMGVSKPPLGKRPSQRKVVSTRSKLSGASRLEFESASAISSAESRPLAIRPMENEPPEPARPAKAGQSASARRPTGRRKRGR